MGQIFSTYQSFQSKNFSNYERQLAKLQQQINKTKATQQSRFKYLKQIQKLVDIGGALSVVVTVVIAYQAKRREAEIDFSQHFWSVAPVFVTFFGLITLHVGMQWLCSIYTSSVQERLKRLEKTQQGIVNDLKAFINIDKVQKLLTTYDSDYRRKFLQRKTAGSFQGRDPRVYAQQHNNGFQQQREKNRSNGAQNLAVKAISSAVTPAAKFVDKLVDFIGDNPDLLRELDTLKADLSSSQQQVQQTRAHAMSVEQENRRLRRQLSMLLTEVSPRDDNSSKADGRGSMRSEKGDGSLGGTSPTGARVSSEFNIGLEHNEAVSMQDEAAVQQNQALGGVQQMAQSGAVRPQQPCNESDEGDGVLPTNKQQDQLSEASESREGGSLAAHTDGRDLSFEADLGVSKTMLAA